MNDDGPGGGGELTPGTLNITKIYVN
jgi:hypothetical protein